MSSSIYSDISNSEVADQSDKMSEVMTRPVDAEFVFPWTGILVNIVNDENMCKDFADNDYWLKRYSYCKPLNIQTFCHDESCSMQAILKFDDDWTGFVNAFKFEMKFAIKKLRRKQWIERQKNPGVDIYGWVATTEDYNSEGPIGVYLRGIGTPQTLSDIVWKEAQSAVTSSVTVSATMDNELSKSRLKEMVQRKLIEAKEQLEQAYMEEKERLVRAHTEELGKLNLKLEINELRLRLHVMEQLGGGMAVKSVIGKASKELKGKEKKLSRWENQASYESIRD